MATCAGSPTFEVSSKNPNRFIEWPAKIPGYICKTPPFGQGNAPRFAQCCSGPVFNITSPTDSLDLAYPMSCALFCQVDPKLSATDGDGLSPHMACLTNGGKELPDWEIVCATNSAASNAPLPTSYPGTFSVGGTAPAPRPTSSQLTSTTLTADGGATTTAPSSTTTGGSNSPAATATAASSGGGLARIDQRLTVKAWVLGMMLVLTILG